MDRDALKKEEERKRQAAYDPVARWQHIQQTITWAEANLPPHLRRNRPRQPKAHRPNPLRHSALGLIALLILACAPPSLPAGDWPQWAGSDAKNMVSPEKGLPDSFVPGEKKPDGTIDLATARNVRWGVRLGNAIYSTPSVAQGKIFVGGMERQNGIFVCLEAATGKLLWKWEAPPKKFPKDIDGFNIGIHEIPPQMGVCSTATIEGGRAYFVNQRFEVMCLDVNGLAGAEAGGARVIWTFDMQEKTGAFPCDTANGSPVIDGDLLYVQTSNGIDRNSFSEPQKEKNRKFPAPAAPNVIALDKRTGRLVATDDTRIADNLLHGQWSSLSLGKVGGRKLLFFGGGDGCCYAFEALASVPETPVRLRTIWSYDCIPPEYKAAAGQDRVTHYCLGDKRVKGTLNQHDGTFVGMSEIIGTPVFVKGRIFVALGRDPEHGRGRGAMHCIDATGTGDITRAGRVWSYQGLDRTLSTASVADGLAYLSDVAGRLHCLDAETGQCYWIHETKSEAWGSTLVADGKVYLPTAKYLWVLKAGKALEVLDRINLGSRFFASPVVAGGTLYVATTGGWLWAVEQGK
jgi:outer membrane protein assembly factor BamB